MRRQADAMNTCSKKKKRKEGASSNSKRQPWTIADDELLTRGFLHVSNNSVVGNGPKSLDFWKRVLKYYTEGDGSGAERTADNLRSHWHMMKVNVTSFNNIMIRLRAEKGSDLSDDELKTQAYKVYHEEHKAHFIREHVWNLVKDDPKWKKQIDIPEPKRTKTSPSGEYTNSSDVNTCINLNNDVDNIPISVEDYEVDELPSPIGTEKAKGKKVTKGKGVKEVATTIDNMLNKKMDMMEQLNAKMAQMIVLKEKKLAMNEMEILYKDTSQMDPETLEFHRERCAMIREKYGKKK
ncbi:putative glutathione transferase [Helianthus debilis subsp. tardiflorus]